jgi:hypothetical protein
MQSAANRVSALAAGIGSSSGGREEHEVGHGQDCFANNPDKPPARYEDASAARATAPHHHQDDAAKLSERCAGLFELPQQRSAQQGSRVALQRLGAHIYPAALPLQSCSLVNGLSAAALRKQPCQGGGTQLAAAAPEQGPPVQRAGDS